MNTLLERLSKAAQEAPKDAGLYLINRKEEEIFFHWKDIELRAAKAAGSLKSKGIKPGDTVGIILPTSIDFFDAFFGAQMLGAIPVPLYPPVRLGKLEHYFERTSAMLSSIKTEVLITNTSIRRILGQLILKYTPPKGIVLASDLKGEEYRGQVSPDHLAMGQFSSGTTQAPKAVGLTHRQILANVDAILNQVPLDAVPNHTAGGCSWLPLYHDMGLIGCIFPALSVPGKMVLIPPEVFLTKPAIWLKSISKHKSIVSPAPNFAYALCTERILDKQIEGIDLSSWKLALNGAEPVAPKHLRSFQSRFEPFGLPKSALSPVYGLAEAALAITFSDVHERFSTHFFDREALSSGKAIQIDKTTETHKTIELADVGRPLNGFAVEIRSNNNRQEDSNVGEIWVKGPSLMSQYINDIPSPIVDGWLNTGDLGFIFEEKLYITGRNKDVLILRGRNHAPHDLEHAVDHIDGVRTGCSVAVSELSEDGEKLIVFIEVRTSKEDLAELCRKAILKATGLNPDAVILLEPGTLPRTSSGKLRRQETLRLFREGKLIPPKKVTPFLIAGAMAKSILGYFQNKSL